MPEQKMKNEWQIPSPEPKFEGGGTYGHLECSWVAAKFETENSEYMLIRRTNAPSTPIFPGAKYGCYLINLTTGKAMRGAHLVVRDGRAELLKMGENDQVVSLWKTTSITDIKVLEN